MKDIYSRHEQAFAMWREACLNVKNAEQQRDYARGELDKVSHELLTACDDPRVRPAKPIVKRSRKPKSNGVDFKAMMREPQEKAI